MFETLALLSVEDLHLEKSSLLEGHFVVLELGDGLLLLTPDLLVEHFLLLQVPVLFAKHLSELFGLSNASFKSFKFHLLVINNAGLVG